MEDSRCVLNSEGNDPGPLRCEGPDDELVCPNGEECDFCEDQLVQTHCIEFDTACCQQAANDIPPAPTPDCGAYMTGVCDGFVCVNAVADPVLRCKRRWCRGVACP